MIINTLIQLFERDLNRLMTEISLYKEEATIWKIEKGISNTAGNLTLHLIGNLNTYIGKELGGTAYVRNRELEFSTKFVKRDLLLEQLNATLEMVKNTLSGLSNEDLNQEYPILVFSEKTTTEYLLVHLTTHLTYHLGQINYHRRLIEG
ncbi:MAG: DinB superfamily protein [Chitinophagaceae bacterium BSSC1]|nr:MAG: DinB superfamily protein [Chitinophagaceae bacterium BSSC1]